MIQFEEYFSDGGLNHQLVIFDTRIPIESHAKNQSRIHHVYTGRILFFLLFLPATPFQAFRQLVFASKYGKCWY